MVCLAKLNLKQKKFADEYIASGNAYQSAIKAGYSESYAKTHVYKLLENARITEYLREKTKELDKKKIATMEEVQQFWASVLRSDEMDIRERIKVSELIARSQGGFIDKVNISGGLEKVVIVDDI